MRRTECLRYRHLADLVFARPSLYDSFNHITRELHQLTQYLQEHKALLDSAHVYPLPSFPGIEQEALLGQLLRKKLDPDVEGWIESAGRAHVHSHDTEQSNSNTHTLNASERRQLWTSAGDRAAEILERVPKNLDYTVSEIVNELDGVETGIKRELRTGTEKVVLDEDSDNEDEVAPMPLEDVLRFMTRGELPGTAGIGSMR